MNDMNSLASRYGVDLSEQPNKDNGNKQFPTVPAANTSAEDLARRYGVTPESEAKHKEDQEYKDLIASKMTEARKIAKDSGYLGAAEVGISTVPVLGNVLGEVARDVYAAIPESFGFATGKTYGERRRDLKAQMAAMERATAEQYPVTKGISNFATSLFLPVPKGAGALGEGATAAQKIGQGLETGAVVGGGYGAAEAASEKYLGTKPGHEDTSIIHGAEMGGLLGGAAGGLLTAAGIGAQKLYDTGVFQKFANADDYAMSQIWKKYQEAQARNDSSFVSADKILEMRAKDPNSELRLMDIGDDKFRAWISKEFEGRPQQAEKLIKIAKDRMENSERNVKDFLNDMGGFDDSFNPYEAKQEAVQYARNNVGAGFERARDPNNVVSWDKSWEKYINEPFFRQAIRETDKTLAQDLREKFVSPFRQRLDDEGAPLFEEFDGKMVPVYDRVNSEASVHYLDQLRRELGAISDAYYGVSRGRKFGWAQRAQQMGDDITKKLSEPKLTDPVTGKKFDNPTYNKPFADAVKRSSEFRGEKNAWDYGQQFAANLNNPMKVGEMASLAKSMTKLEKKYFTQSLLNSMSSRIFSKQGMELKQIDGFFNSNTNARKALENALTKERVDAMEVFLRSQYYQQKTARGFAQLGTGAPPESEIPLNAKMFVLGHVWPLMRAWATEFAHRQVNRKYAQKLANLLSSDKVEDVVQGMRTFQYNTKLNNAFMKSLDQLAQKSPALLGIMSGQNIKHPGVFKSGGRVAFKDGGKVDKKMLKLAEKMGRNGDTILAHINRAEAEYLRRLGGSGKINPKTGLREFGVDDGPEAGSTGSASGNSYGGGYSAAGGYDSPSESGPGPGMGGGNQSVGGGGGGGGGSMAAARAADRASVSGYSGDSYGGGGGNAQLNDFFNQTSRFGGSEIMSPLQGMSNGVLTGQPPRSQEQMLKAMGIEGAPTPGLVGGIAAPGNVAETGQAATTGAGLAMGLTNVAKEAQASGFNTPYGASGQGVFSDANAAATEKMQLDRAAADNAKAQSQIDAQNASAALPTQAATGLVSETPEKPPQTDLSSIYSPAITDFGEAAYAPPVGRFESTADQPSPQSEPSSGLLSSFGDTVSNAWNSLTTPAPGAPPVQEDAPGQVLDPFGTRTANKIQDRAPGAETPTATSGIVASAPSQPSSLPPLESVGDARIANIDMPTAISQFREQLNGISVPSGYGFNVNAGKYANDPESGYYMSDEQIASQIRGTLGSMPGLVGSTVNTGSALLAGDQLDQARSMASKPYAVPQSEFPEGAVGTMTLDPSKFVSFGNIPLPPERPSGETQIATNNITYRGVNPPSTAPEAPRTRGIGLVSPAAAAEASPSYPNRPITPTPDWAYAPETAPSPTRSVSVAQATPPEAPDNTPKSRTIEDFTGPDQTPYQPTGGGGRDTSGAERPAPRIAYGQGGQRLRLINGQWYDSDGNVYEGDLFSSPMESQMTATGGAIRFPEGRVGRATGGRIPDMDKAFKAAKKSLDGQTKVMLNANDDDIVHALRIAKGYH